MYRCLCLGLTAVNRNTRCMLLAVNFFLGTEDVQMWPGGGEHLLQQVGNVLFPFTSSVITVLGAKECWCDRCAWGCWLQG